MRTEETELAWEGKYDQSVYLIQRWNQEGML